MNNRLQLALIGAAALLIIVLAAVLIFVVAGGDGDKKETNDGNSTPSASSTEDSGDNGGGGASDGELILRGPDPLFLDPAVAQDADSAAYIVEIFSGLVRLGKGIALQPDL